MLLLLLLLLVDKQNVKDFQQIIISPSAHAHHQGQIVSCSADADADVERGVWTYALSHEIIENRNKKNQNETFSFENSVRNER